MQRDGTSFKGNNGGRRENWERIGLVQIFNDEIWLGHGYDENEHSFLNWGP